jgi:hypothetical protein
MEESTSVMQDPNLPDIDVDQLMENIRQTIAERRRNSIVRSIASPIPANPMADGPKDSAVQSAYGVGAGSGMIGSQVSRLEPYTLLQAQGFLGNAEARAHDRTKWPDKLQKFPFTISQKLQRVILKIQNAILLDQRIVNLNLIQSVQTLIEYNQQLTTELTTLRAEIEVLKATNVAAPTEETVRSHRQVNSQTSTNGH